MHCPECLNEEFNKIFGYKTKLSCTKHFTESLDLGKNYIFYGRTKASTFLEKYTCMTV